jgi:hypothetical protein
MKYRTVLFILMFAVIMLSALIVDRSLNARNAFEAQAEEPPVDSKIVPVLVELFTSEGCSSCPPADELLANLERTQPIPGAQIITLGEHVDYWNRLGWADPFSSAQFSARQSQYANAFNKDDVYTPQAVVDGRAEFVGSNASRAREAIAAAARSPKAAVTVSIATGVKTQAAEIPLRIRIENIPAISASDTAEVLLAITESNLRSEVARGENSGRSLKHTSVVRRLSQIGNIDSKNDGAFNADALARIEKVWKRENLKAVVFVQERASRRVLGVALLALGAKE